MKRLKMMTTFLILTLLTTASFADENRREKRKEHFKQMMSELNLNEDQVKKFSEYKEKHKGEMKAIKKEMKSLRGDIKDGFINKVSDTKLTAMHKKMGELHEKSADIRFHKMLFLKDILTKEQRESFMSHKDNRKKRK